MVSLIVRDDSTVQNLVRERPSVREGKLLSGSYRILSVPDDEVLPVMQQLGNTKIDAYSIVVGLLGKEALDAAGITPVQQQPFLDLKGRGVLLGFVDTGIDYTQDAFRYENNTSKIQYIWDQTAEGDSPAEYGFGAEYANSEINRALRSPNPFEIVPHRDTVGHGTFLASVAGSRKAGEGAAPEAEIVAVKLRKASPFYLNTFSVPPGQENVFDSADVIQGIEYILDRAFELGRPVAVCVSVGTNLGGHDGFTVFEEYLSRVSHRTGVTLCAAAGNEADTEHHTSGVIKKEGEVEEIEINVGQNAGDVYMHIVNNAANRLSVAVSSPTGEMVGRVPAKNGSVTTERLIFEKSSIEIFYFFPIEGSGAQLTVIKILDATPGIWTILAHGDIIIDGKYHAWLPLTGLGNPGAQFLAPIPESTVVVPASAVGVITCGAFSSLDKSLYPDSSWGPTRLPSPAPDLAAPGSQVSGTFPTGTGEMSGTSVAAAITTGACALLLQWGIVDRNEIYVDTYLARAYLIRGCDRDPALNYPNSQWGYGRLNLQNTFNLLRRT
ncbi:MAG: S8 family peptidase [Oscillospiraceae bacterium]|jgi:subtilisin family serine protease|nr:S8 family peptidase [Oscillospiraceae bacterium]